MYLAGGRGGQRRTGRRRMRRRTCGTEGRSGRKRVAGNTEG
ncbi:hypothetical protein B8V81_2350 [Paenibacillus pasadenensis]|uniref:Uncharacterized protein n=1 Tax=Paenibacillus pasadenensis TaxID=217090 RepID=A0A2N5N0S2_9BACL|nr:hypothetical protein B8V81_2350 [Paenibacillus pasadenensis]